VLGSSVNLTIRLDARHFIQALPRGTDTKQNIRHLVHTLTTFSALLYNL
jgi:hypothetical protein